AIRLDRGYPDLKEQDLPQEPFAWVQEVEGSEGLSGFSGTPHLSALLLSGESIDSKYLESIGRCPNLKLLKIDCPFLTRPKPTSFSAFSQLELLSLSGTQLDSDAIVGILGQLRELRILNLGRLKVSLPVCEALAKLPRLTTLYTAHVLSDAELNVLLNSSSLSTLEIHDSSLFDGHLQILIETKKLHLLPIAAARDGTRPATDDQISALHLSFRDLSRETLSMISSLKNLTELDLSFSSIDDDGAKVLLQALDLRSLDISRTALSDRTMAMLSRMDSLEILDVVGCSVTNEGLNQIANIPNLRTLKLGSSSGKVNAEGIRSLEQCRNLTELSITNELLIDDEAIAVCGKIPKLRSLDLSHNERITGKNAAVLAALPNLCRLRVRDTYFADEGAKAISRSATLSDIDVGYTAVSESGLLAISRLKNLRAVDASLTNTTADVWKRMADNSSLAEIVIDMQLQVDDQCLKTLGEKGQLQKLMLALPAFGESRRLGALVGKANALRPATLDEVWSLNLKGCAGVTDVGAAELVQLRNLRYLDLRGTRITERGLLHLATLKNLRVLKVTSTFGELRESVKALRRKLPECRIGAD
ncbi:MAG: leucine-rich repeat domain-containing protein, partial [Planctomycetaceae bacterium]|nr:leucine-rich repeat domain-containing protein [Planctomycetaceae bacterium]